MHRTPARGLGLTEQVCLENLELSESWTMDEGPGHDEGEVGRRLNRLQATSGLAGHVERDKGPHHLHSELESARSLWEWRYRGSRRVSDSKSTLVSRLLNSAHRQSSSTRPAGLQGALANIALDRLKERQPLAQRSSLHHLI